MDTTIQLQKHAAVLAADGHSVGSLNRVVVNPDSKVLNAIVVRVGTLFNREEKVVPIKLVAEATENQIVLNEEVRDVESFPPFEEEYVADANMSGNVPSSNGMVTRIKQNIPQGTIAMDENPKIITLEGIHAGNVERLLADPSDDHVTHLLVSNGLLVKAVKLIPIQWVTVMGREHIHLGVKRDVLEELADVSA